MLIDQLLTYKQHVMNIYTEGTCLDGLLPRLATVLNSLTLTVVCQLYLSVVVPSVLYAADIFITPIQVLTGQPRKHGFVGHVKRLVAVQQQAALIMCGGLRSSPSDALNTHA